MNHIVQGLRERLKALETERDVKIEAINREYADLISQVEGTLRKFEPRVDQPVTAVGEERLTFVQEYLRRYGADEIVRQADIAAMLEIQFRISPNSASGTASAACRRLEMEGLIEAVSRVRGSNAWRVSRQLANAA